MPACIVLHAIPCAAPWAGCHVEGLLGTQPRGGAWGLRGAPEDHPSGVAGPTCCRRGSDTCHAAGMGRCRSWRGSACCAAGVHLCCAAGIHLCVLGRPGVAKLSVLYLDTRSCAAPWAGSDVPRLIMTPDPAHASCRGNTGSQGRTVLPLRSSVRCLNTDISVSEHAEPCGALGWVCASRRCRRRSPAAAAVQAALGRPCTSLHGVCFTSRRGCAYLVGVARASPSGGSWVRAGMALCF